MAEEETSKKSRYVPTGYPRGRPRKGETRPLTKNALYQQKYRERNREKHAEYNLQYVKEWNAKNPEREREIRITSRKRIAERNKIINEVWFKTWTWIGD